MSDAPDRLTPATPEDLADALAFARRFDGRKRKHDGARVWARGTQRMACVDSAN
jgi:hypothetical protein